jgi:hypothetical protein
MSHPRLVPAAVAAILLFAASSAFAQAAPDSAAAQPAPAADSSVALPPTPVPPPVTPLSPTAILGPNSPAPSRPHMVSPRGELAIRQERDQMAILSNAADNDLLEAKKREVEAKGTVEIKKREIDTIAARAKAAKQAKDEPTRAAYDAERKRQESMRDYFSHAQDVTEAAIDEAQARGEYARASVRALDLETQLVGRGGVATYDADPGVFKLEQQYLEALKQRGAAQEKYANRLQTLADRKLRLYRGWADYLGGK